MMILDLIVGDPLFVCGESGPMTSSIPSIRFFSSDLDGTLLGKQEPKGLFKLAWNKLDEAQRPLLCYNTGRLIEDTQQTINEYHLPDPDYIIGGVGTSIYDHREKRIIKEFAEILVEGWDLDSVEKTIARLKLDMIRQPEHLQNEFKSSWFLNNASYEQISTIEKQLEEAGVETNIVYSGARYLDIVPKWANKGSALSWLLKQLHLKLEETIVAGDSGNDTSMFLLKGVRRIIVANAQPELYAATRLLSVYHAEGTHAEGVIEGLSHYGVMDGAFPLLSEKAGTEEVDYEPILLVDEALTGEIDEAKISFLHEAYSRAVEALRRNITPLGFSACSLEDNKPRGTDENYHSVWARDGAITIIGSLPLLKDDQIHECQVNTFETLLNNIAPNGQIPTNVRIRGSRPEYSGVGGIASIDSALWLISAFYEYIKTTRRLDFLRRHIPTLQKAMDWLGALDSNNDALLEIPEAGDWTDLLGSRYNVLYDEVLWYHANICFGRMLGWLGEDNQAGYYLRLSQIIKREILKSFWPSTQRDPSHPLSFDDQQYTLGDAQFLIAQVTPFDYSWRCDVYGNILAYLYNVLDTEKAWLAFHFMYGVGINEPYPAANIYPPINVGELDWRRYYTVNLLNLPNHYHNGGIWPFIGAQWVRFINKLGLRNLALQELYKLAELNKAGVHNEWEFNEWAHGVTGRPMGKVYQAWSASEFILTCHALKLV